MPVGSDVGGSNLDGLLLSTAASQSSQLSKDLHAFFGAVTCCSQACSLWEVCRSPCSCTCKQLSAKNEVCKKLMKLGTHSLHQDWQPLTVGAFAETLYACQILRYRCKLSIFAAVDDQCYKHCQLLNPAASWPCMVGIDNGCCHPCMASGWMLCLAYVFEWGDCCLSAPGLSQKLDADSDLLQL